jgi:hypothetical protein
MPATKSPDQPRQLEPCHLRWFGPALALFSLILTLAIIEFAFRIYLIDEQQRQLPHFGIDETLQARLTWIDWQQQREKFGTTTYPSSFDAADANLGWKVRPNADARHVKPGVYEVDIHTNSFGLRGSQPSTLAKRQGVTRIGVFGCSQTFGETVGDDETYATLLDKSLNDTEVLNFGVRGYGTDQMLLYYQEQADKYDLDIVVIAFAFYHLSRNATGFSFYAKPVFRIDDDGELEVSGIRVPQPDKLSAVDFTDQLWNVADHSIFLRWVWQRVRNLRARQVFSENGDTWRVTKALLSEFVESARTKGSTVVIMNIDESHPELEDELQKLADGLSVELVNLGPVFRDAAFSAIQYALPGDNHWTPLGHEIVARKLQSHLCNSVDHIDCSAQSR